jgi:hypothetical protein
VLEEEIKDRYNKIRDALKNIGFRVLDDEYIDTLFFTVESKVVKEIENIQGKLDMNTLNNLETILFIKLATTEEIENLKKLIQKKID